jgi:hypothetical protein
MEGRPRPVRVTAAELGASAVGPEGQRVNAAEDKRRGASARRTVQYQAGQIFMGEIFVPSSDKLAMRPAFVRTMT